MLPETNNSEINDLEDDNAEFKEEVVKLDNLIKNVRGSTIKRVRRKKSGGSKKAPKFIYFDNNGTTPVNKKALVEHNYWLQYGYNPSSDSKLSLPSKKIIEKVREQIYAHCRVTSLTHEVIFNSGGSEGNCFIIRSCVKAFKRKLPPQQDILPHIVIGATEHHSSISCIKDLLSSKLIEVTWVMPRSDGSISAIDVKNAIKSNTCLISVMSSNNEIPIINPFTTIGTVAEKKGIPYHSDCVQMFGKYPMPMKEMKIDIITMSAHKFGGPKSVGAVIISKQLIDGYELTGEINGAQHSGLRGGTENVAGIASMGVALEQSMTKRQEKNKHLLELRNMFLELIETHFKVADYSDYYDIETDHEEPLEILSLGPSRSSKSLLCNTILLVICKNKGKAFCNIDLKKFLDERGFVISIGSTCNTDSKLASHVVRAIKAPQVVKKGIIRISFGDQNTEKEVIKFYNALSLGIRDQCKDIDYVYTK